VPLLLYQPAAEGIPDSVDERVTPRRFGRTAVMNVADDGDVKWIRQAHGAQRQSGTLAMSSQTRISRILTNEYRSNGAIILRPALAAEAKHGNHRWT